MPLFPFGPPKYVLTVVLKSYKPSFVLTVMGYMTKSLPLKNLQSNQVAQQTREVMWVLTVGPHLFCLAVRVSWWCYNVANTWLCLTPASAPAGL